jgi:hypothetical protein
MKKHTREDDLFIKKVKEVLDDDVESLDGAIRSRLNSTLSHCRLTT